VQYFYKDIKRLKLKKDERKELQKQITALDKAILGRAKSRPGGASIFTLINSCRPFKNRFGGKEMASSDLVRRGVTKLVKLGLLEAK